ncbi:uncharacterized protein PGTG_21464 [Puccinia graminis f. sp. tritici CRL 75-36-700-3]|uniref:Uncharacterized protein n=1 Tax=Puccinia graminis f. sp. tritici (strain CRL 75-36-700-3 / race SCCL) TaxID=418459 RepID=H6QRU5_PUCGT|nr:uncharacterized protein PGTG_21464 [Puccinia graminis f. sp. tritici CRL 75-36-700-3]EHS63387.1 hypothetical protein PGTG_21464 [Puccinia graminis f. sp. tritici CRL 75-36-700-3]
MKSLSMLKLLQKPLKVVREINQLPLRLDLLRMMAQPEAKPSRASQSGEKEAKESTEYPSFVSILLKQVFPKLPDYNQNLFRFHWLKCNQLNWDQLNLANMLAVQMLAKKVLCGHVCASMISCCLNFELPPQLKLLTSTCACVKGVRNWAKVQYVGLKAPVCAPNFLWREIAKFLILPGHPKVHALAPSALAT